VLLAGAVEVNALAQGALRQFTEWLWIEHPTFQLGGGHFTTELLPPHFIDLVEIMLKYLSAKKTFSMKMRRRSTLRIV